MNNHSRKTKQIIRAAIKLFVKNGIHGTSIAQIAKKAGVATGSIYTYFDSKERLVNDIFQFLIQEEMSFFRVGYNENVPIKQRFDFLLRRAITYKLRKPEKFQFMSLYAYSPIIMKEIQSGANCPDDHPFVRLIKDAKAEGLVKDLPKEDLFFYMYGGFSSLLRWKLFEQQEIVEKDVRNMIELTWDAIKK